MSAATPVVRGNFIYNGDLHVDVGNLNRHKRATVAEITELLRPSLKKSKNTPPVKDQVGHWYEAQLIHYGLPASKDKATAKMRLLDNLNNSKLKVPAYITGMESELKKEFAANERKAKARYKKEALAHDYNLVDPAASKKRKQTETISNIPGINVNINLGMGGPINSGVGVSDTRTSASEATIRKKQTARRSNAKAVTPVALSRDQAQSKAPSSSQTNRFPTKQTARRGRAMPTFSPTRSLASGERSSAPYQVMPNGRFSLLDGDSDTQSPKKKNKKSKTEDNPPGVKTEGKAKNSGPKVKIEPKSRTTIVKAEPKIKRETNKSTLGLINGIYDITCLDISSQWDTGPLDLTLTLDSPSVWGAYDFGMFTGILHLTERPWAISDSCYFHWRGRENGEGEMSFGDDCNGEIRFLGGGEIEGWINLYGKCGFTGKRRQGPGTPVRTAVRMRAEWDGYNDHAYERERVGRWGGEYGGW